MKQRIAFTLGMSLTLSIFMSGWVTFVNIGLEPHFVKQWIKAWIMAWPVAAIISFIAGPAIHRWSMRFAKK